MRKGLLVMTLGLLALSAPMFGAYVIDFGAGLGNGGTIVTNENSACSGTGTGVGFTNVCGFNISVGLMNVSNGGPITGYITSGTCTVTGGGADVACLSFNEAADTVTVTGSVPSLSGDPSGNLLSGTGDTITVTPEAGGTIQVGLNGPDTKLPALLTALGFPSNPGWTMSAGIVDGNPVTGTAGLYNAFSQDIPDSFVPEPTSVLLLGTILFGVTGLIRRHAKKA